MSSIDTYSASFKENSKAHIVLEPLLSCNVHMHTFFEFEFALSGSILHIIEDETTVFQGGDIWFISPSTVHHFMSTNDHPGVERYTLYFDPALISEDIWKSIDIQALPLCLHAEGNDFLTLQHMFQTLLSLSDTPYLSDTPFVKWTLEWLILYLFRNHPVKNPSTAAALQPALLYIQSHFREDITVEEVSSLVHFSTAHFSRLFHKHMGMNYRNYLLNLRLSYAYGALRQPEVKVTEVCFDAGFRSLEYFSRAFKKKFGISPLQYHHNINIPDTEMIKKIKEAT